jgi:hypothetical protein
MIKSKNKLFYRFHNPKNYLSKNKIINFIYVPFK